MLVLDENLVASSWVSGGSLGGGLDSKIEEISLVSLEELSSIEGFDANLAKELKDRAHTYLTKLEEENQKKLKEMGVDEYIEKKSGLNHNQLLVLAENNILTRDELADLSSEELIEILKDSSFEKSNADQIILSAREHWFKD